MLAWLILVLNLLILFFVILFISRGLVKVELRYVLELSRLEVNVLLVSEIVVHSSVYHFCALKSEQGFDSHKWVFSLYRYKLASNSTNNFTQHVVDRFKLAVEWSECARGLHTIH